MTNYDEKNTEVISLKVKPGLKQQFKVEAYKRGTTMTALLEQLIEETIGKRTSGKL